MQVLVTGCAGFIGYHVAQRLLARGDSVVGLDNLNDYYDVALKQARLDRLTPQPGFRFERTDLADNAAMVRMFEGGRFAGVVHMAAQAGVRYSIANPLAYAQSNLIGFTNILEGCHKTGVGHLVYASSSSVYGGNRKLPFAETDPVDHPVSFYAATKKSNELMAHAFSHVHRLPATGLRFFTVYGPWGRPDMSPMLFADAIMRGKPIQVFNHGDMARDFTYIDDIVEGVVRTLDHPATPDPAYDPLNPDAATSDAPWRVFNIGNHQAVGLLEYISTMERVLGKTTEKIMLPMQPGDVQSTYADTERLQRAVGFAPSTRLEEGLTRFAQWFKEYYGF